MRVQLEDEVGGDEVASKGRRKLSLGDLRPVIQQEKES